MFCLNKRVKKGAATDFNKKTLILVVGRVYRQARRRKAAEVIEQEDLQAEKAHDKVCDNVSKGASSLSVLVMKVTKM